MVLLESEKWSKHLLEAEEDDTDLDDEHWFRRVFDRKVYPTGQTPRILCAEHEGKQREVVHERKLCVKTCVQKDRSQPQL